MEGWPLLVLIVIVLLVAPSVVAILAHTKATVLGSRLAALKSKVEGLETQIAELRQGWPPQAAVQPAPGPAPAPPEPQPLDFVLPVGDAAKPADMPAAGREEGRARFEEQLTSRWLLWLGAAALALSGLFLITYAVERGLLTPAARIALALALGAALTAGGEWVRRHALPPYMRVRRPDMAAGALTSAGIFVSFASLYAAESLYGLISPHVAFLGLGAVALMAFALAAVHAPIVAALGLLAGFLTPALVPSDDPSVWGLFGYLTVIVVAALAVVRYRDWPWLAFGAIAGAAAWTVLWIARDVAPSDVVPLAGFQMLTAASAMFLACQKLRIEDAEIWDGFQGLQPVEWAAWSALALAAFLIAMIVDAAGANDLNLAILGLAAGLAIFAGRRWQRFDALILFAALAILIVFALKPLGAEIEAARQEVEGISGPPFAGLIGRAAWPHLLRTLLFALLLAAAGYAAVQGAKRPQVFAAASTLGAALLLALTYARLSEVSANGLWAMIATGAAGLALGAAMGLNESRGDRGLRLALGIYAAAVVAGVSFAFAFVFRNAWLTIALSLQLPALAWLEERLDLRELRLFALAVASAVLVRLALNPYVLDYDATAALGAQWILYGYGIPAAAFLAAAWLFRHVADDLTVSVLQGGALAFALLLAGFEIRLAVEGRIDAAHLSFIELSLHSLLWLAVGWWRGRAYTSSGRMVDAAYAVALIALGSAAVLAGQLILLNPAFTGEAVGEWPILNALLIGYLAPAVLFMLIGRDFAWIRKARELRLGAAIAALLLAFTWVSLETKHAFQGSRLLAWHQSDAEYYAYSVVWLCFAFALLAAGLWRRQAALRYGALAVLLVTVLKVFISDMAGLGGLYRVASFLGLGLSLVAIGWIYQRFVYPAASPPAAGEAPPLR